MANEFTSRRGAALSYLALGCVGAIAFAGSAQAQSKDEPARGGGKLGGVTVTSTAVDEDTVKVESAESPKYTRPLLDTPQTITVISNVTMRQQNLLTLREALTTIPGITFGAGEGGGGYGDSINLRGQSANTDIQIDGVRDSAQYSRSDTFNLEQIEVVNGANSVYAGSGSISGTINLITKRPKAQNLTVISGGIGTADYYRATIDSNVRVSDNIAVRLNGMFHRNNIASRDFEYFHRWGVAPAITIGIDGPTKLTLLYTHQEDENIPVYGVPYYASLGGLLPGAKYSGYYGYKDFDRQDQTVDQLTAIFEHEVSDNLSVRNLTRWQRVEANTFVDPPQGTFCLSTGVTTAGVACGPGTVTPTVSPGFFQPSGPRGTVRLNENSMIYNQLDVKAVVKTGFMEHTLTFGTSVQVEDYKLLSGNSQRNPGGVLPLPVLPQISISNPNPVYGGPVNFILGTRSRGDTTNIAFYAFDTIKFSDMFEVNGGVRWERNRANFRTDAISTTAGATFGAVTTGLNQQNNNSLFSYRVGAVFKPIPDASLYAAFGNSKTPASSSVRGGCGLPSAQSFGFDPCDVKPQEARNYEIGGKIDLMDHALQLTASVFRNERTNFPVATNDAIVGILQVPDGRSRVDGVSLGASGKITPKWTVFANYTYLDSKVLQSVSNYCLANPGKATTPPGGTAITCPASDVQAGNQQTNTPNHSGSLFTTYQLPLGLQVGYGLTYQGSFLLVNTNPGPFYKSSDWLTHRAYVSWNFVSGLTAQLNVQNFTNERYFTGIRNNGWATPGEGRSALLTVTYSF